MEKEKPSSKRGLLTEPKLGDLKLKEWIKKLWRRIFPKKELEEFKKELDKFQELNEKIAQIPKLSAFEIQMRAKRKPGASITNVSKHMKKGSKHQTPYYRATIKARKDPEDD